MRRGILRPDAVPGNPTADGGPGIGLGNRRGLAGDRCARRPRHAPSGSHGRPAMGRQRRTGRLRGAVAIEQGAGPGAGQWGQGSGRQSGGAVGCLAGSLP